jgi:hypothetical protein
MSASAPEIDPKTYWLGFTGLVENRFELSYDERSALP